MSDRTLMLRRYELAPGTAEEFGSWWSAHIPALRERAGFAIEWAYLDAEHEAFTWAISHPGDREAFLRAERAYEADPDRAAAIALAPPLRSAAVGFPERLR
ncbi:hypothetical protein J4H92_12195 [Leucobacter weissii]|uniref:NIPSNAP domain-containing protein n=1 Tax=Leucobacter weissii TaxID=1983706 RepID=A0A939MQ82_9MICO|nr:hypothetical protein [Leucobacter weissii]MBO1902707.1 hypothetical protein [Leucobacter weissii]